MTKQHHHKPHHKQPKEPVQLSTAYDEVCKEMEQAVAHIEPQIAGLKRMGQNNPDPAASQVLTEEASRFEARLALMRQIMESMLALLADGYPAPLIREVPPSLYANLTTGVAEEEAAMEIFEPAEETAPEPEEPQP